MANIHHTISEVKKLNPELARQIEKYVKEHSYGLVFEENLPEAVRLWKKTITVGDTVNILPPRGQFETDENKKNWLVTKVGNETATVQNDQETREVKAEDLVTTVSYKDIIYPGLKVIDRVERGDPNDPYHMVINAENYHALQALIYAYAGKVDCIYIDPPYNKPNSKDWKYNCDYVDGTDKYRHSKWLAFMKRRIKLAKKLLNPDNSVLIVTIDEVEYARLGLLLEQLFPEANIQMISSCINYTATARRNQFDRINEFIFIIMIGNCHIFPQDDSKNFKQDEEVNWRSLRRQNSSNIRDKQHPNQFFPIFIDVKTNKIAEVGDNLPFGVSIDTVIPKKGCETVFPIKDNGIEMMWGLSRDTFLDRLSKGYVKIGKHTPNKPQKYVISFLEKGMVDGIANGDVMITGKRSDGSVIAVYNTQRKVMPKTQWSFKSHDSREYGTYLLDKIIGEKRFSYPKSLYAVEDCLKYFISGNPNALIVDFFGGSGTTLHAVNLINAEDSGKRRCIIVTNNEVSETESKNLTKELYRQGDDYWEKFGIAQYVAWPRVVCSINGRTSQGTSIQDSYLGRNLNMSDGFKANAIFCELTYESEWPIRLDNAFNAIAPLLWMQAGCRGKIIDKRVKTFSVTDYYGVLFDYYQASKFCDEVSKRPNLKHVFVVTDDQRRYSNICRRLPNHEVHRLYETFLKTFQICGEGGLD